MTSFSKSDIDKSKICLSFILLLSFLISSPVYAYELPQTLLRESSSNSITQKVIDNEFPSTSDAALTEKQENQHYSYNGKGNVFKNPKPTSSQNLEMDQSGVSSMSSLRHSVGQGYKIPTLEEKENQHYYNGKVSKEQKPTSSYDLERKTRGDSSMQRFNHKHSYKTTSSKESGKSDVPKDVVEDHNLELEGFKWDIGFNIGRGNRHKSKKGKSNGGGGPGSGDLRGDVEIGNGGDYISTEPMNYNDASMMRHQNMKKFSTFDLESFRESQAAKRFGMKSAGKVYHGGVPRMEDVSDEDKKN